MAGYGAYQAGKNIPTKRKTSHTDKVSDRSIKYGSDVKSADKLKRQMDRRGWTTDSVRDTVENAFTTRKAINRARAVRAAKYICAKPNKSLDIPGAV